MLWSVASAQSSFFVNEASLPAYMLDQKDPLFYSEGVIATSSGASSLCGPTSVMNWLQLRHQNAYSKIQLVNFVQVIGNDLRAEGVEINNGLTEPQLLRFLEIYNTYLEENSEYVYRNRTELEIEEILNATPQILMLRYTEPVRYSPGRHRDDFKIPLSGAHYVLKVGARDDVIFVIDPENPTYLTQLKLEETKEGTMQVFRLRPQRKKDLQSFSDGVPLIWSMTGLIQEK